jgi:hypothetical protein
MRSKDGSEAGAPPTKRAKTSDGTAGISIVSPLLANQLNYVGAPTVAATQTLVPDDLNAVAKNISDGDPGKDDELKTEGLPPNAVDEDGNILVTDWDILAGRGGLTNHHRAFWSYELRQLSRPASPSLNSHVLLSFRGEQTLPRYCGLTSSGLHPRSQGPKTISSEGNSQGHSKWGSSGTVSNNSDGFATLSIAC